jgi:KDO2-lipid IV(A) lauroyltransferase
MTAHFGAWEMSSFAHALYGYPLKFVVRPIDNPRVEQLISGYRMLSGNVPIQRKQAARDILRALRQNEAVGILFDQNTTRSEGVFAEFFGIPAATTPSIALFALRARAAVIPGFLIWDEHLKKHRLRLDPPVELVDTGDLTHDVFENTTRFNQILEGYIREYPDQWLWKVSHRSIDLSNCLAVNHAFQPRDSIFDRWMRTKQLDESAAAQRIDDKHVGSRGICVERHTL